MSNEDDDILSDAEKILYFKAVDDNGSEFFESRLTEENLDEELQKIRDYYFEWLEYEKEWKEMRLMQGNVPYVEHCEVCGASDGNQTEGCDDCGITHYQTSRGLRALHGYTWGFFHKDSPLWEKYQ